MHRSTVHRAIQLAATLAVATTIAPRPAATQPAPEYFCSAIEDPVEVCVGEGEGSFCALPTHSCQFDYDGATGFERTAYFFELRGSASDPPFIENGDRHCYEGEQFSPLADSPDAADYGYNRFAILLPADYVSGPFPVYLDLRGALAGWVGQGAAAPSAWALDVSVFPFEWEKGPYRGALFFAQGSFNNQNIMDRLLDTGPLRVMLRAKTDPSWGFLVPSACSHDGYNGRPNLHPVLYGEAEQTRFGYVSIAEALQLVEQEYGIDYLFSGATSGGGMGSYIFARDLPIDLPFLSEPDKYRGAIVDAAPVEFQKMADLYDPAQTIMVDTDDNCANLEAEVPCAHPAEPLESSFTENGSINYSASDDIENLVISVPLLHSWNKRGNEHCYDVCYSEANIHGPIRVAIATRKLDQDDIPFRFSENVTLCVGSCKGLNDGPVLTCTAHGVIEEAGDCAEDWIDAINLFWDEAIPYGTPASCLNIPAQGISSNPAECKPQNQGIDM